MLPVRVKFACIVALCVLPLAIATFVISRALEGEQREDAVNRLSSAERAFEAGLDEDVARLQVAARTLTTAPGAVRAVQTADRAELRRRLAHLGKVWPGLRVLVLSVDGHVLAASHREEAKGSLGHAPAVRGALEGRAFEGVARLAVKNGADAHDELGPSYAVIEPLGVESGKVVGAVLAAFPFDRAWVEGAERRHGLDLSLAIGGTVISRLESAGGAAPASAPGAPQVRRVGDKLLAVSTFAPPRLKGAEPALVAASLDLTRLASDHRRFLTYRLIVVALVALVALGVAAWLARGMRAQVQALRAAFPAVAEGRYEPVEVVRTGDELEALARTWNRIATQLREADLWKRALGKYLSRAALEHIKKGDLQLGGTTVQATVLFSDIRGFTSLAERMPPEQLLRVLNRYFTEMVTAVMQNDGIVDKFIGDCIMAVWGPPTPSPRDAQLAVKAALEMRRRLDVLNREFAAQGLPELQTGIGIHSGPVVAGNIGAEGDASTAGKMEYTVIGDTVNLASRLESMTKEMKVDVLLSEDTVRLAEKVDVEALSEVKVRGRESTVRVYRLLAGASKAA
jgi:adenylate cyclase